MRLFAVDLDTASLTASDLQFLEVFMNMLRLFVAKAELKKN